ncbi:MAG: hypothetical protein BA865_04245 [Desulfobacterales bacterium S5133MH4]|nr:MAG: hypothetical protein BA865_04245 [Desulfobacterales bacterium S5133MH4]
MEARFMKYDNTEYWTGIHKTYEGHLQAVGHPTLCRKLNELKYQSEGNTMLDSVWGICREFRQAGKKKLSILDVGAGTGYWSKMVYDAFDKEGFHVRATALDMSEDALDIVRRHNPQIDTVQEDLKTINPDLFTHGFDLVISCYCLHHLVNLDDFLNALRFVARSVSIDGFLIIMDPVLTLPFSRFDVIDFPSYQGNGIPRHLYLIEDVLVNEGLCKKEIRHAVSFLLNGNIEGYDWFSYTAASALWRALCVLVYKSESFVRLLSGILSSLDRALKGLNMAFSSSVCVCGRPTS